MEDVKTQNDTFTNLERLEELITYWPQVVVNRINPPDPVNQPDNVNHPSHYAQYPLEVIEMMVRIWGKEKVATFCEINAFKYRMRAGHKDNVGQDLGKEAWYLEKAKELREGKL